MPEPIHLLTSQDFTVATVRCGAPWVRVATTDPQLVTCPECLPVGRRRTAGGMSEQVLQETIRQAARAAGFLTYHPYRNTKSEPGWVDLVLAKTGHPLRLIEFKSATGVLTPPQQAWIRVLSTLSTVETHVWRPDDLERALEVLR